MSGIANLSMDHSKSDECLNKSSPPPTELKQNSSGVNLLASAGGEAETMNAFLSGSSRFEVTKTSADGSHVLLHDERDPDRISTDSECRDESSPVGSYDNQHTFGAPTYRTVYQTNKSLRHYTKEALPRIDNYRNMESIQGDMGRVRPTVEELRGVPMTIPRDSNNVSISYFSLTLGKKHFKLSQRANNRASGDRDAVIDFKNI